MPPCLPVTSINQSLLDGDARPFLQDAEKAFHFFGSCSLPHHLVQSLSASGVFPARFAKRALLAKLTREGCMLDRSGRRFFV